MLVTVSSDKLRDDELYRAIKGRGGRRCKDKIHKFNIENDWYKYKKDIEYK